MKKLILLLFIAMFGIIGASAKGGGVVELNDSVYTAKVAKATKPYVIDFSATWCRPCQIFAPVFHSVAGEMGDKFDFYQVDIDKTPALGRQFKVRAVPTIVIYNPANKKSQRIEGMQSREDFIKSLRSVL